MAVLGFTLPPDCGEKLSLGNQSRLKTRTPRNTINKSLYPLYKTLFLILYIIIIIIYIKQLLLIFFLEFVLSKDMSYHHIDCS